VDEVIKGGRFPVVDSSGCLEPIRETMSPEGTESDAEEEDESGEADAGGRGHGLQANTLFPPGSSREDEFRGGPAAPIAGLTGGSRPAYFAVQ
jgi:hypothetical protein